MPITLINATKAGMAATAMLSASISAIGGGALLYGTIKVNISLLLTGAILFIIAGIILVIKYYDLKLRRLVIDNGMIYYSHGIVEKVEYRILVKKINGTVLRRSIFHRVFGGGELRIACEGISSPNPVSSNDLNKVVVKDVQNYQEIMIELSKE